MWQLLDGVLITVVVAISAAYAIYALSPGRAKRAILGWLARIFGVRIFSVFSPRIGGCDGCGGAHPAAQLRKSAKTK